MSSTRAWLFRVLVLASGGLLAYSWFTPWWSAYVRELGGRDHIVIMPWILDVDKDKLGMFMDLVTGYDLPVWFFPAMWAYLGIVIAALLFSLFAKDKVIKVWKGTFNLPSLIIGIAGFSYIVVAITMVIVTTIMIGDALGMKFIGVTSIYVEGVTQEGGGQGFVVADLQLGYWLAWGAGTLLIILALLRNKIIGKRDT